MQKQTPPEATKTVYPILRQIVNLIPPNVFHAAASATMEVLEALQGPVEFNADSKATQILGDEVVRPSRKGTAGKYTAGDGTLRRVTAMVEVRRQMRRMVGEAQHRPASRNVWDGRRVEIGRDVDAVF